VNIEEFYKKLKKKNTEIEKRNLEEAKRRGLKYLSGAYVNQYFLITDEGHLIEKKEPYCKSIHFLPCIYKSGGNFR
jgi:hypothetical protein